LILWRSGAENWRGKGPGLFRRSAGRKKKRKRETEAQIVTAEATDIREKKEGKEADA